ncbi:hypothetical protein NKR23_g8631 [Pleurostoma richardsiae]|uniref:Uncharacterized protein n=1 Tax=Pleurostoma richardsiae TaxID=41990 RepID=A0AA38RHP1_9PEZI|nr:hypothetical protein NKR23_g8631 [Pleurostoma richardsiae]
MARKAALKGTEEDIEHMSVKFKVIQHSFENIGEEHRNGKVTASPYGFAGVLVEAYQKELHLAIRPHDVSLAILQQFRYYIDKHARRLCPKLVKLPCSVTSSFRLKTRGPRFTNRAKRQISTFNRKMTRLLKDLIKEDHIDWMLPKFSNTHDSDRCAALVTVAGTIKEYFSPVPNGHCGFPSVTLLGQKADWQTLCSSVLKMRAANLSPEVNEWAGYLEEVVMHMLACFDEETGEIDKHLAADSPAHQHAVKFWNSACSLGGNETYGSQHTLGGWITAFCYWNPDGSRIYSYSADQLATISAHDGDVRTQTVLRDRVFPVIPSEETIPAGYADLTLGARWTLDDGSTRLRKLRFLAGMVGMKVSKRGRSKEYMVVQPQTGYWLLAEDKQAPNGPLMENVHEPAVDTDGDNAVDLEKEADLVLTLPAYLHSA